MIALFLLVIGVILVTVGFTSSNVLCPAPTIEYRYKEPDLDEAGAFPLPSVVHSDMFTKRSTRGSINMQDDSRTTV